MRLTKNALVRALALTSILAGAPSVSLADPPVGTLEFLFTGQAGYFRPFLDLDSTDALPDLKSTEAVEVSTIQTLFGLERRTNGAFLSRPQSSDGRGLFGSFASTVFEGDVEGPLVGAGIGRARCRDRGKPGAPLCRVKLLIDGISVAPSNQTGGSDNSIFVTGLGRQFDTEYSAVLRGFVDDTGLLTASGRFRICFYGTTAGRPNSRICNRGPSSVSFQTAGRFDFTVIGELELDGVRVSGLGTEPRGAPGSQNRLEFKFSGIYNPATDTSRLRISGDSSRNLDSLGLKIKLENVAVTGSNVDSADGTLIRYRGTRTSGAVQSPVPVP